MLAANRLPTRNSNSPISRKIFRRSARWVKLGKSSPPRHHNRRGLSRLENSHFRLQLQRVADPARAANSQGYSPILGKCFYLGVLLIVSTTLWIKQRDVKGLAADLVTLASYLLLYVRPSYLLLTQAVIAKGLGDPCDRAAHAQNHALRCPFPKLLAGRVFAFCLAVVAWRVKSETFTKCQLTTTPCCMAFIFSGGQRN